MKQCELCERYLIPKELIEEYDAMRSLDSSGDRNYDDADIANISQLFHLSELGFDRREMKTYWSLLVQGIKTAPERLAMLNVKREELLQTIHENEELLEQMDYLRYELMKE